jgi:hypothetical protein
MPQAKAIVKGEGGAGIVFQYQEPSNNGIHYVIRVRKASWLAATSAQTPAEHELEREVWSDIVTAAGDVSSLSADVVYSQRVVAPLLGPQYVPTQVRCSPDAACCRTNHACCSTPLFALSVSMCSEIVHLNHFLAIIIMERSSSF